MHALEVLIRRDLRAAGRECGHAERDQDEATRRAIIAAARPTQLATFPEWDAWSEGYLRGLAE